MAFTIDGTNWQDADKMNEIAIGLNERLLATNNVELYPTLEQVYTFDKKVVRGYQGKIYQCIETHDTDEFGTFEPDKWEEMRIEIGSDIQGMWYSQPDGSEQYDLTWWGWRNMHLEIESMISDFVQVISIEKINPDDPLNPMRAWWSPWTLQDVFEEVNLEQPDLFVWGSAGRSRDWTRIYRDGLGGIVIEGGRLERGDAISDILIREISAVLDKLRFVWKKHDGINILRYRGEADTTDAVCDTARTNQINNWTMPLEASPNSGYLYRNQGIGRFRSGVPDYRFESDKEDIVPQTASIPIVDGIGFDWKLYGYSSDFPSSTDFAVPTSVAALPVGAFTKFDEFRYVLSGTEVAGTTQVIPSSFVGGANLDCPLEDLNITCPLTLTKKGFSVLGGLWVLEWDFTN